ncbi:MAG: PPC domain-containing protein, partial [Anaerolineae bacterium]|nr:PPC domain-containing protein [Anaerolineae bacterium]
ITVFSGVDPTTSCPGQFVIAIGSAAPAGALSYGDSISGSVSGSAYAENWSFAGSAGDVVTITMVADSGDLDPYLYLLNARGAELTSNDDAADASIGTFNAQIASFTLPESGQYTIKATRFGDEFGSSSGTYTLTLAAAGTSSAPLKGQPGGGTMTYGDTVTGTITQAAFQQDWTFTGAQGDAVTITMVAGTGSDLDSYISLLGPNGMELTSNDDASDMSVGALNSQIAAFVLPADGTYTIRATRFGSDMGASTGAYELSLELTETTDGASISYGDTVTGEITNSVYEQAWVFDGTAGDVITITMVDASGSATLDSYLTLQDPSGRELLSNDDAIDTSVGALNAQIAKFQLPSTGSFTIIATRFGGEFGSATGAYELTLTKVK